MKVVRASPSPQPSPGGRGGKGVRLGRVPYTGRAVPLKRGERSRTSDRSATRPHGVQASWPLHEASNGQPREHLERPGEIHLVELREDNAADSEVLFFGHELKCRARRNGDQAETGVTTIGCKICIPWGSAWIYFRVKPSRFGGLMKLRNVLVAAGAVVLTGVSLLARPTFPANVVKEPTKAPAQTKDNQPAGPLDFVVKTIEEK